MRLACAGAVPAVGEGRGVPQEPGVDADELPRGLPRVRAGAGASGEGSIPQQCPLTLDPGF